jgi:hypothetical protein
LQELHRAPVERLTRFGQAEPARRPVQQARLQVRLELADLA